MTHFIQMIPWGATLPATAEGMVIYSHCASLVDQDPPRISAFTIAEAAHLPSAAPVRKHPILADQPGTDGEIFLAAFVRRKSGMTMTDFTTYSLNVHALMDAKMPGLQLYEQYHTTGEDESFDCLSLFRFENMEALEAALGSDVVTVGTADLKNFIDPAASLVLVAKRQN